MLKNLVSPFTALFLTICIFLPANAFSQGTLAFGVQGGIPSLQMAQNLQGDGAIGFGVEYMRRIRSGPLSLGMGISNFGHGQEYWNATWAIGQDVVSADHTIESRIFDIQARARYEFLLGLPVLPYLNGFAGVSMLKTTLTVVDVNAEDENCNNDVIFQDLLNQDETFVFGGGFGVLIPMAGRPEESHLLLDLGLNYRNSGRVQYMHRDSDRVFTSSMSMWLIRVGLTWRGFRPDKESSRRATGY